MAQVGHVNGVMAVPVSIEGGRVVDGRDKERFYPAQLVLVALGFTGPREAEFAMIFEKNVEFCKI